MLSGGGPATFQVMGLPSSSVTLTVAQVDELNEKLSRLRHDINNHLSLMVAAVELIKHNPDGFDRMVGVLTEQPSKISEALRGFSVEFEKAVGITRG